ncbi:hypothetical protein ABEB36_007205 [Hypothenemus hampei]|uniref:FYVE-type domain-containing protein n=1 Tax=Hypothenemus hampei TaxID=57062 RepID=A0ABD1EW92_HYPHA
MIFNLETTCLAKQIVFTDHLLELKDILHRTVKIREIKSDVPDAVVPNLKLQFDDIIRDFFQEYPVITCPEWEEVIKRNIDIYPFLECYRGNNEFYMNLLDLVITQGETLKDSKVLMEFADQYKVSSLEQDSKFADLVAKLLFLLEDEQENRVALPYLLSTSELYLSNEEYKRHQEFYCKLKDFYEDFCQSLSLEEPGVLNGDHNSHKIFLNIIKYVEDPTSVDYLQKLFNYLKAFSRVFYIEKNTSQVVSKGKNSSYFSLLTFNRSELMGHLLFQKNLKPVEFENYFEKLKLDFLYHVAGNCFPTVNLHAKDKVAKEELYPDNILYAPDMAVIMFVKRRHWLLSILLTEMYQIEGLEWDLEEYRVQTFVNHMRLPRIKKLTPLFKNNEILASLHYEISYQTVHDFVYTEIGRHNFVSSNNAGLATLEKGEEIEEHELKTTNWKQLYDIIDSIPEKQFRNNVDFLYLKDVILVQLVRETFECNHHHYALEIINNGVRVNLLLEHMKCWPPDFCVNFIKREMSKFNCHSKEIVTELKLWLKYIEHSLEVMEVLDVTTWGPMYEMCSFEPKKVLFKFLSSQKIELLLEFLEYHEVSERMLLYINEEFVEMAFNMDINILHVEKILEKLTIERRISVCHGLLNTLNTITHLQFVTNYVLKFSSDEILSNIALSLKILSIGSESEIEHQFLVLLKDPLSIIEIMIMNLELDKLSSVLDIAKCEIEEKNMQLHISVAKVDALLRRYAEKSLDFRVVLAQPQSRLLKTPELKLLESLDTIQPDTELQEFIPPEIVPSKDQWVNNSEVFQCMCCKDVTFSMFNRRHHCRRCGRAVCYTCSLNRMIVPTYGDLLVRVCLDCFKPKIRNTNDPDESNSSIISTVTNYWMLSNDMEHNRIVREEFSFEFTPSVSLCLALMKFHSKNYLYSKFLLEQCDILLKLLIPNQEPVQELDHMLVIRMLKSLAVAAKMSCQETNCERTSEAADILLSQVELLELLAAKSCLHLLYPIRNVYFIDGISLMRLTDKLVEREQWSLALEVTTKFGTDPSGLFVAWGLNYLKAGCFTSAREKFGKYFEKNKPGDIGGSSQSKNPPLVNKIIELLESIKEPIDSSSVEQPEKAQLVLSRLKRLKDIQAGNYYTKSKFLSEQQPKLEETIYNECVYYLDKYGTPLSLVHFHIKYRHFKRALDCLIAKQMPPEVFVEIYIRCLNEGLVVKLQGCMSEIDSTLGVWKNHLMKICCYLDKRNYLNTLYQLQLFMGDYVRATVTCIKFYEENCASFADLLNNISYLKSAVRHLNQAKEQEQWVAVSSVKSEENLEETFEETSITSPLIKTMTSADIEKHTSTILMQIRLTEYFADCEKKGVCPRKVFTDLLSPSVNKDKLPLPTLFGSEEQRKYVAMMCIICGDTLEEGFAYGLKIIKEFKKLKPVKVYKEVGKYFAQKGNFSRIGELVNWIRNCSEPMDSSVDEVCDELLLFAVASLRNSPCSGANVDDLIKLISDKSMKISACIEARKLNSAYCLAAKYKRLVDMKRIIIEAELSNQLDVRKLCQSFITKHSQH